jgi:hypothetical protein
MSVVRITQPQMTRIIDALQWTVESDDLEAVTETRKRARQCGPDCVALLHYVVRADRFASVTQRVRAASLLLNVGEFLSAELKSTDLFHAPDEADGATERAAP